MIEKTEVSGKRKGLTKQETEQILIDNFTNLQRVLTNLSIKFDELSTNMSKLLQLFEISAKSFAEKYSDKKPEEVIDKSQQIDKEYLKKLDSLLDQNKTIAKGIMLMENKIRTRDTPQSFNEETESRFGGMNKSNPLPKY
ncbi:MAG: hypothetical protein WCX73_01615 [Candidatus Pacearchaeota archaeon]|jgi:hypothetical protein